MAEDEEPTDPTDNQEATAIAPRDDESDATVPRRFPRQGLFDPDSESDVEVGIESSDEVAQADDGTQPQELMPTRQRSRQVIHGDFAADDSSVNDTGDGTQHRTTPETQEHASLEDETRSQQPNDGNDADSDQPDPPGITAKQNMELDTQPPPPRTQPQGNARPLSSENDGNQEGGIHDGNDDVEKDIDNDDANTGEHDNEQDGNNDDETNDDNSKDNSNEATVEIVNPEAEAENEESSDEDESQGGQPLQLQQDEDEDDDEEEQPSDERIPVQTEAVKEALLFEADLCEWFCYQFLQADINDASAVNKNRMHFCDRINTRDLTGRLNTRIMAAGIWDIFVSECCVAQSVDDDQFQKFNADALQKLGSRINAVRKDFLSPKANIETRLEDGGGKPCGRPTDAQLKRQQELRKLDCFSTQYKQLHTLCDVQIALTIIDEHIQKGETRTGLQDGVTRQSGHEGIIGFLDEWQSILEATFKSTANKQSQNNRDSNDDENGDDDSDDNNKHEFDAERDMPEEIRFIYYVSSSNFDDETKRTKLRNNLRAVQTNKQSPYAPDRLFTAVRSILNDWCQHVLTVPKLVECGYRGAQLPEWTVDAETGARRDLVSQRNTKKRTPRRERKSVYKSEEELPPDSPSEDESALSSYSEGSGNNETEYDHELEHSFIVTENERLSEGSSTTSSSMAPPPLARRDGSDDDDEDDSDVAKISQVQEERRGRANRNHKRKRGSTSRPRSTAVAHAGAEASRSPPSRRPPLDTSDADSDDALGNSSDAGLPHRIKLSSPPPPLESSRKRKRNGISNNKGRQRRVVRPRNEEIRRPKTNGRAKPAPARRRRQTTFMEDLAEF